MFTQLKSTASNNQINSEFLNPKYTPFIDLLKENEIFKSTDGVSKNNENLGFIPAFLDKATGIIYLSRFINGTLSPVHIFDGLPDNLINTRSSDGSICSLNSNVISGFSRIGLFYSREQAANIVASQKI
jgi:hypothetical protein